LDSHWSAYDECTKCREDSGNNRPWTDPGTPAAKYSLLGGREAKRVLKSLKAWSLKNTWNSDNWYLC